MAHMAEQAGITQTFIAFEGSKLTWIHNEIARQ